MGKTKQLSFVGKGLERPSDRFGGSLLTSNPKTKRPLDSKWPIHLVVRARESTLRTPKNFGRVQGVLRDLARKYGVRVYRCANVGNHLHLVARVSSRSRWNGYIRELTGRIARFAKTSKEGSFWLHRPFTRIVRSWRKAFRSVCDYVHFNQLEAEGHIRRSETRTFKQLHAIFSDTG